MKTFIKRLLVMIGIIFAAILINGNKSSMAADVTISLTRNIKDGCYVISSAKDKGLVLDVDGNSTDWRRKCPTLGKNRRTKSKVLYNI